MGYSDKIHLAAADKNRLIQNEDTMTICGQSIIIIKNRNHLIKQRVLKLFLKQTANNMILENQRQCEQLATSSQTSNNQQQEKQPDSVGNDEIIDIEKSKYQISQEYSTLKQLKNYIKTSFLHCPQVTFRYSAETENLDLTTYLKEFKNNIACFENITFIFQFTKSIDDYKKKNHKTIVGGYQKEFRVECNVKAKKMKLILDYLTQFTFIDEVLSQKYATQQSKLQNLEGIYLQRDIFEAVFLIKQMHKFNSLEFAISKVFLPMNLYKVFEFWTNLRLLIISCDQSKITIDNTKKIMQIKLFHQQRELAERLHQILGTDMSENYQKIVICDFPFKKEEIEGFQNIDNIIKMKVDLNVDFEIKTYSHIDLFKYFSTQKNMNTLYFRCLPFPTQFKLNDRDFNSICQSIIKLKNLSHLYLDINFTNQQILRVNRIEFKINQKQVYLKLLNLLKTKYPGLSQMRWEIKFELLNMFLTEKMRELKPTLDVSDKNIKKNLIYQEYYYKF